MQHDFLYLTSFVVLAVTIFCGSRRLSPRAYSKLLAVVLAIAIALIAWFNTSAIVAEGESLVHSTVLAFAQFGVLSLAFKVWLALNWEQFPRPTRRALHLCAHAALLFVIVTGYWLKATHSVIAFLLYPLSSLSVALVAESIEEFVRQRDVRP